MLSRALFEDCLTDEAQFTLVDREHRRRSRFPIDHAQLTGDRAWAQDGQDPVLSPRRAYNDFEEALIEQVATIAGISGKKQRLTGFEMTEAAPANSCADKSCGRLGNMPDMLGISLLISGAFATDMSRTRPTLLF